MTGAPPAPLTSTPLFFSFRSRRSLARSCCSDAFRELAAAHPSLVSVSFLHTQSQQQQPNTRMSGDLLKSLVGEIIPPMGAWVSGPQRLVDPRCDHAACRCLVAVFFARAISFYLPAGVTAQKANGHDACDCSLMALKQLGIQDEHVRVLDP